jgi:IS1 family transposase
MSTVEERFWAKVNKTENCWLWTAARDRRGYGHFWTGERMTQAHRFSMELATGRSSAEHVDHICHTPSCINPAHLRRVTRKQNMENRAGEMSNNKSGYRGVCLHKSSGLWQATVGHNGKQIHLGYFRTPEAAGEAARAKRLELYTHNEVDKAA